MDVFCTFSKKNVWQMLTASFGHISQIGGDVGGLEEDVSVDDALIRLKLTNLAVPWST